MVETHVDIPARDALRLSDWLSGQLAAERAAYLADGKPPSAFPYGAQIRVQWSLPTELRERNTLPARIALFVHASGESLAIGVRAIYESLVGRLTELSARHGTTDEERYDIRVSQARLDAAREGGGCGETELVALVGLWRTVPWQGNDLLRKWERRYALSTEYAARSIWVAMHCLAAVWEDRAAARPVAVVVDRWLAPLSGNWPDVARVRTYADGSELLRVPCATGAFATRLLAMANEGAAFVSIAGRNEDEPVLVSVANAGAWQTAGAAGEMLARREELSGNGRQHALLRTDVGHLAALLRDAQRAGADPEAVFAF